MRERGPRFERARGYVQLTRPGNAVMAAVGGGTGFVLAEGEGVLAGYAALLAPLFIAGFGNIVNDLRDLELDRQAHPARPLPSGRVDPREAWAVAGLLLLAGLLWALAGGWPAFALASLNAALLALYEVRLKVRGLPGNLLIGLLVASTFLYGGVVATGRAPDAPMLLLLAGMAMLSNVARELLKDIEDIDADRGHRRTFPMRHGAGPTRILALVLAQAAVLGTFVAFLWPPDWWAPWLILLALADALFIVGSSMSWMDVGTAQRVLKIAMGVALAAFVIGALSGPAPRFDLAPAWVAQPVR